MKNTLTISLICILSLGFISSAKGQKMISSHKAIIEKQVETAFRGMIKFAENMEFDKLNAGVEDKHEAGFITNGIYYARYDSLIPNLINGSRRITRQSIKVQKEKITVLSETIALVTAVGETTVDVNLGNTFTAKFFWTFVYEKIDNNWKVIQSHQSNVR